MSLKSLIQNKDKAFTKLLASFDAEYNSYSIEARKAITKLFRAGTYDTDSVSKTLAGFGEIADGWAMRHNGVLQFAKEMTTELGIAFTLTVQGIADYNLLADNNAFKLKGINELFQADIQKFGLQSQIEGKSLKEIQAGLEALFTSMGRRLSTEAFTGIGISDAIIKKDLFDQAGIEKYYYDGPYDSKTRDVCEASLKDGRQSEGWTLDEVNASNTPFIERGGYNCRHEWLPFFGD